MNQYNITLHAVVNVRVPSMPAATPHAAITAALDSTDLYSALERQNPIPGVEFTEYAEEVRAVLVDVVGDQEYEQSQWFTWQHDQWAPENITVPARGSLTDLRLNASDRDAMLAGLRLLQHCRGRESVPPEILDVVSNNNTQALPTDQEIDELCERLNTADLRQGAQ